MTAPVRATPKGKVGAPSFNLTDIVSWYTGLDIPDPITFCVGEQWCNRPNMYPRQATLMKIIFLREDLFTAYDYEVIEEWTSSFRNTGYNGIQPDLMQRLAYLREQGRKWFKEVLLVMGRRAGKGHLSALAQAYVLWNYLAMGDPQNHYGVDRSKRLTCLIFAGKREQAKANLWKDLVNVITEAPCFTPYISKFQAESLTIFAPQDFVKMRKMAERGVNSVMDPATFEILPKESTLMAGRGQASFMMGFDEMAHVVASGANRSAEEVYAASTPSLDQFGKDGFIVEPSSPWQMMGQFYVNYQQSLEFNEDGTPKYPDKLMVQLASWDIYIDWEIAHQIPMFPACYNSATFEHAPDCEHMVEGGKIYDDGEFVEMQYFQPLKGAIQTYDDDMVRLKMSNPETFAVERESKWAAAMDAYLNEDKIKGMFREWNGRLLVMQEKGTLVHTYKAHSDPSKSNANFATAIAHPEFDDEGNVHCVFDFIHHFDPADFPDHTIDYDEVEQFIWGKIRGFVPEIWTFDQWNSASMIQRLQKKVREANFPKNVQVYEETATAAHNWKRAENFKTALNMGWVHAPYYEQAELELKFLQEKNGKVEKPTMGPVQTKDVADCIMECVMAIVGDQVNSFMAGDLSRMRPTGALGGGITPFPGMSSQDSSDPMALLASFSRSRGGGRESGYGMQAGRRQALRPKRQHRA